MTPSDVKTVVANLDDFIELPDGIDRLRKAVFTLATSGKLVPQDPKEGAWKQTSLGEIGTFKGGSGFPKQYQGESDGDIPFFKVSDMNLNVKEMHKAVNWISETVAREVKANVLPKGTIIFPKIGGAIATNKRRVLITNSCIDNNCLGFIPDAEVDANWIFMLLSSIDLTQYQVGTSVPALNIGRLSQIPIGLPPAKEQRRIVQKINAVMTQLDELEARKMERDAVRARLTQSAMRALGNGEKSATLELLPELVKTKADVAELDKAILTLAVSGKLVPQNPKEGTVDDLLKKAKPQEAGGDKKRKAKTLEPIKDNEIPFAVPPSWKWVYLEQIGDTNIGLTYSPSDISEDGTPVLRSSNIQQGALVLNDLVRVNADVKESVLVKDGDLLICARNGSKALVGKTAMIRGLKESMAFGAFMAIFRSAYNPYIELFLKSPVFRSRLEGVGTMTINQITQSNLKSTLVPLPPAAEQKRIVSKVQELEQGVQHLYALTNIV